MSNLTLLTGHFKDETIVLDGRLLRCTVERVTFIYSGGELRIDELLGSFCLKSDVPGHPNVQRLAEVLEMPVFPATPPPLFGVAAGGVDKLTFSGCHFELRGRGLVTADGPVNVILDKTTIRR